MAAMLKSVSGSGCDRRLGLASVLVVLCLVALLGKPSLLVVSSSSRRGPPADLGARSPRRVWLASGRSVELDWDGRLGLYRIAGRPVVWAFWHKGPVPPLLALSLASLVCHNSHQLHVEVVGERDVGRWLDHVHPAFHLLQPQHKADYFRARVLDELGGAYVDADTLAFRSLAPLYAKLLWYDLVNISWPPDGDPLSITVMGPMRAGNRLTAAWVTDLHLLLDAKLGALLDHSADGRRPYPLGWSEILRRLVLPILRQLLAANALRYFSLNGPATFGQLVLEGGPDPALDLADPANANASFTFAPTELLMFHYSQLTPRTQAAELSSWLASPTLLAELTRLAFLVCRRGQDGSAPLIAQGRGPNAYSVAAPPKLRDDMSLRRWILHFVNETILTRS